MSVFVWNRGESMRPHSIETCSRRTSGRHHQYQARGIVGASTRAWATHVVNRLLGPKGAHAWAPLLGPTMCSR
jgi:hypothetical protein